MRRSLVVLSVLVAAAVAAEPVAAQTAPSSGKKNNNTYGSPLDTIMSTHLWTDVGPAQDFVRESRPDTKKLDYAPLVGTDPDRPKPRDKANVAALQAEMEHELTANQGRARAAGGPVTVKKPAKAKTAKVSPTPASAAAPAAE